MFILTKEGAVDAGMIATLYCEDNRVCAEFKDANFSDAVIQEFNNREDALAYIKRLAKFLNCGTVFEG